MIDNFELINSLLQFKSKNDFFFIQILKRKKENPEMKRDSSVIDNFFLYDDKDLLKLRDKISSLCAHNNARAYIRMNVRSLDDISLRTLGIITECIIKKDYRGVKSAYLSACGSYHSDTKSKWVIDIDTKDDEFVKNVIDHILNILPKEHVILAKIPTKNGYHLLTNGFNPTSFRREFPTVEIKEDTTLLYAN